MANQLNGSDEREFLHDLASPLSAAIFLLDSILDSVSNRPNVDEEEVLQLGQIHKALERVKTLLKERREVLIKRGVPSART